MKRLEYTYPHDLGKLHDELLAAIPPLRPTTGPGGIDVAVMLVEGDDTHVWLTVPDNANERAIAAVVAAHDPTPLPPGPTQAELFDGVVAQAQQALTKAATVDQIKAVFAGTLDGLKTIYGTGGDT
jgi:hypothetical protein